MPPQEEQHGSSSVRLRQDWSRPALETQQIQILLNARVNRPQLPSVQRRLQQLNGLIPLPFSNKQLRFDFNGRANSRGKVAIIFHSAGPQQLIREVLRALQIPSTAGGL